MTGDMRQGWAAWALVAVLALVTSWGCERRENGADPAGTAVATEGLAAVGTGSSSPGAGPGAVEPAPAASVEEDPGEGASPRRQRWAEVEIDELPAPMEKLAKAGRAIYEQQCLVCHGKEGKGDGPAAGILTVPPRNFTAGMFKFKTSLTGEMPFDDDLYRTVSAGIPAAGMPSFGDLTAFERWALVAHVKELSRFQTDDGKDYRFFEKRPAKTRMPLPTPPAAAALDLKRGEELYRRHVQCNKCHGDSGTGDGPSAADLVDAFENPIAPADLTRGEVSFKAGSQVEDVYRVLAAGMAGTPMPAFVNVTEEDKWILAYYVVGLYRPIDPGERTYLRVGCTSCHTIGKGKLIGPDLAGVTKRRTRDWLKKWLKDPPSMLATDETARKLLEEYLSPMPSYGLSDREIDRLIQYMETMPDAPPEAGSAPKK